MGSYCMHSTCIHLSIYMHLVDGKTFQLLRLKIITLSQRWISIHYVTACGVLFMLKNPKEISLDEELQKLARGGGRGIDPIKFNIYVALAMS